MDKAQSYSNFKQALKDVLLTNKNEPVIVLGSETLGRNIAQLIVEVLGDYPDEQASVRRGIRDTL